MFGDSPPPTLTQEGGHSAPEDPETLPFVVVVNRDTPTESYPIPLPNTHRNSKGLFPAPPRNQVGQWKSSFRGSFHWFGVQDPHVDGPWSDERVDETSGPLTRSRKCKRDFSPQSRAGTDGHRTNKETPSLTSSTDSQCPINLNIKLKKLTPLEMSQS